VEPHAWQLLQSHYNNATLSLNASHLGICDVCDSSCGSEDDNAGVATQAKQSPTENKQVVVATCNGCKLHLCMQHPVVMGCSNCHNWVCDECVDSDGKICGNKNESHCCAERIVCPACAATLYSECHECGHPLCPSCALQAHGQGEEEEELLCEDCWLEVEDL
jgi:hypothetical protein